MSSVPPAGVFADPSTRVLALPFTALGVSAADAVQFTAGMPAPSFDVARINLVIGTTPVAEPMFRDVIGAVAHETGRDTMLLRTGLFPETMDPVRAEVALNAAGDTVILTDLSFYRHRDGGLWLIPAAVSAYFELTTDGLRLHTTPPFSTWYDRSDGLCRAAAEIVRIVRRRSAR